MDIKSVLQEQIRELQKLQDENINSKYSLDDRIDNAIKLSTQICALCKEVNKLTLVQYE